MCGSKELQRNINRAALLFKKPFKRAAYSIADNFRSIALRILH